MSQVGERFRRRARQSAAHLRGYSRRYLELLGIGARSPATGGGALLRSVVVPGLVLLLISCSGRPVVPATLGEAHRELERMLPKEELARIDAMKSEKDMIDYHSGLGMGLRNDWGLWRSSPLAQHMRQLGFSHPDDMSATILETFWCLRHGQPFRLQERAGHYAAYWKAQAEHSTGPIRGSINVQATVGKYSPHALHEDYTDGRWATFDAVAFTILSPPEWQGTNLVVYCSPGKTNPLFQKTGAKCSFTIQREYLADASNRQPFDGALENLKEIK